MALPAGTFSHVEVLITQALSSLPFFSWSFRAQLSQHAAFRHNRMNAKQKKHVLPSPTTYRGLLILEDIMTNRSLPSLSLLQLPHKMEKSTCQDFQSRLFHSVYPAENLNLWIWTSLSTCTLYISQAYAHTRSNKRSCQVANVSLAC